ncbi:MAG: hypothetical protein AAF500_16785 [Myxococcota bacterium]
MRGEIGTGRAVVAANGPGAEFVIRGSCMDCFEDGERISLSVRRFLLPGDPVVVRRANHFSAHRFLGYAVGRHGLVVLTQADHDTFPDPAAPVEAVIGVAEVHVALQTRLESLRRFARAIARRLARGRR